MAASEKIQYTRVPGGKGRGAYMGFGRSSLWTSQDHLLLVELRTWTERYFRFYYRDIQGFVLRETKTRAVLNLLYGGFIAFCLWIASLIEDPAWLGTWMIFAVIFGFGIILNMLAGPSCEVFVLTRVQSHRLASLGRRRKALKVIERLRPLLDKAQAQLPALQQHADWAQAQDTIPEVGAPLAQAARQATRRAHWLLAAAWGLLALSELGESSFRHMWSLAWSVPANGLILAGLVWAMALNRRGAYSLALVAWTWLSLAVFIIMGGVAAMVGYRLVLAGGTRQLNSYGLIEAMLTTPLNKDAWLDVYYQVGIFVALVMALLGLAAGLASRGSGDRP